LPKENRAIFLALPPLSSCNVLIKAPSASFFIYSSINKPEFLTRLPNAPAALALVFSSLSLSKLVRSGMQDFIFSYKLALWKLALPMAKQAN
jgi:hypothetical protein